MTNHPHTFESDSVFKDFLQEVHEKYPMVNVGAVTTSLIKGAILHIFQPSVNVVV